MAECATLYNAALQEWRDAWMMQRVSVKLYDQHKQNAVARLYAHRPDLTDVTGD